MKTKEEILDSMFEIMPWQMIGKEKILPYIKEAMEIYARQFMSDKQLTGLYTLSTSNENIQTGKEKVKWTKEYLQNSYKV